MESKNPYSPRQLAGQRLLQRILLALTILTIVNLLFSASIAGLIGGVITLVMVFGLRNGDWPLRKGLSFFLYLYAAVNLAVLLLTAFFSATAQVLSLIWLGVYSLSLLLCGILLRKPEIGCWIEVAPTTKNKEKKFHFLHGGWRDL